MKRSIVFMILGFLLMTQGQSAFAEGNGRSFEVTITNLTRGQQFTPILVASHEKGVKLFTLGDPAIPDLATLAEGGATGPLSDLLSGMSEVGEVKTSMGLLDPGGSVTVMVYAGGRFDHVSVASMLIPTNDAYTNPTDHHLFNKRMFGWVGSWVKHTLRMARTLSREPQIQPDFVTIVAEGNHKSACCSCRA